MIIKIVYDGKKQEFQVKKKEIEKERDLLIAQLHDVQGRLEDLYIESAEKDRKLAESEGLNVALREKLEAAESELEKVESIFNGLVNLLSREVGVGASGYNVDDGPLAGVKLLVEQKVQLEQHAAHAASMQEELIGQLHGVQENFESYYLKSQDQIEIIEELEEKIKSKNRKLQKLSQKKRNAVENAQALEVELGELRAATSPKQESGPKRHRSINILGKVLLKRPKVVDLYFKEVSLIKSSSLFDDAWYLAKNRDVEESGMDPALHYLLYGAEDRRDPSAHFSTEWYLNAYPDVAQEKVNPLLHYLTAGKVEGRKLQTV